MRYVIIGVGFHPATGRFESDANFSTSLAKKPDFRRNQPKRHSALDHRLMAANTSFDTLAGARIRHF